MKVRVEVFVLIISYATVIELCKYEKICKNHTMCMYQERVACDGVMHDVNIQISQEIFLTHLHNEYRNQKAMDKASDKLTNLVGPKLLASNMKQVFWNSLLATFAQRYANSCYVSVPDVCRDMKVHGKIRKVGQLVARFFIPDSKRSKFDNLKNEIIYNVINAWFLTGLGLNEEIIKSYKEPQNSSIPFSAMKKDMDYRAFTQLLWAETREIGCGYIEYYGNRGHHFVMVCNYAPVGNIPGRPVYKIGRPCSKCKRTHRCKRMYNALCSVAHGLNNFNNPMVLITVHAFVNYYV